LTLVSELSVICGLKASMVQKPASIGYGFVCFGYFSFDFLSIGDIGFRTTQCTKQ